MRGDGAARAPGIRELRLGELFGRGEAAEARDEIDGHRARALDRDLMAEDGADCGSNGSQLRELAAPDAGAL